MTIVLIILIKILKTCVFVTLIKFYFTIFTGFLNPSLPTQTIELLKK